MLTKWLSWKPGNGYRVEVGRDRIVGLEEDSFLSIALIKELNQKQISVLAQVWRSHDLDTVLPTWLSSFDMNLSGPLAEEWEKYKRALQASTIAISNTEDELI
jgi:hypothetical protein